MKILKLLAPILSGVAAAGLIGWLAYLAVSALVMLIPAGPYAGLFKALIILASICIGGTATVALAIGVGILVGAIIATLLGVID